MPSNNIYDKCNQAHTVLSRLEQRLLPGSPVTISRDRVGLYYASADGRTWQGISIADALAKLLQEAPPAERVPESLAQ